MNRLIRPVTVALSLLLLLVGCSSSSEPTGDTGGLWTPIEVDVTWQACSANTDCALVELACCDHCNGGQLVAVHTDHLDATKALAQTGCDGVACTLLGCSPKHAVCAEGVCTVAEPVVCASLGAEACDAASECVSVRGAPAVEWCVDDLSNWMTVFAGCMDAELSCGAAETCAKNEDTGEALAFPSTCVPPGWETLTTEQCCAGSGCAALDETACAADATCAPITAASPATACLDAPGEPEWVGCKDKSAVCTDEEVCAQGPAGQRRVFSSGCLPAGWNELAFTDCCPADVGTWTACTEADECALLELGCCDHCNGGWLLSVHQDHVADASAFKETACTGSACTELACEQPFATCHDGKCGWEPVSTCTSKSETECAASSDCAPLMGTAEAPVCAGNYDGWMDTWAGCHPATFGCDGAETCAIDPKTDERMIFPSGCLPAGWSSVPCCPQD